MGKKVEIQAPHCVNTLIREIELQLLPLETMDDGKFLHAGRPFEKKTNGNSIIIVIDNFEIVITENHHITFKILLYDRDHFLIPMPSYKFMGYTLHQEKYLALFEEV